MRAYIATQNLGKLSEMRAIFAGSRLDVLAFPAYTAVDETGMTYQENAFLKARALSTMLQQTGSLDAVIADDSGMEIDALQGRPGIHSARYGGVNATWDERIENILNELRSVPDGLRQAKFISVIAFCDAHGRELIGYGEITGSIAVRSFGGGGFGYDPIFVPSGQQRTFAEFSSREKNGASHRAMAARALLAQLP